MERHLIELISSLLHYFLLIEVTKG